MCVSQNFLLCVLMFVCLCHSLYFSVNLILDCSYKTTHKSLYKVSVLNFCRIIHIKLPKKGNNIDKETVQALGADPFAIELHN